jgi:hypothetical protein
VLDLEMDFQTTLEVVRALRPRRAVLSHIEEPDGLGPEDANRLAAMVQADGLPVAFAYDTMRIDVSPS